MNDQKPAIPKILDFKDKRKLYKEELIEACIRIANLRKPIAEISQLAKPFGIPYYTVFHVFIGRSNHPEVLNILSQLGIPHNRKPIRNIKRKIDKLKTSGT